MIGLFNTIALDSDLRHHIFGIKKPHRIFAMGLDFYLRVAKEMANLEIGIQFHLPTYAHVPLPHLIDLAKQAESKGVNQLWATDNLRSRNTFVVLAAFACNL